MAKATTNSITFSWTISAADRAVSLDGLSDVIQTVHWRYRGTDSNGVTAETYGATPVGAPNPANFTAYNSVTATDVEGWLEALLSIVPEVEEGQEVKLSQLAQMKANVEAQIALLANPVSITAPLYSAPLVAPTEVTGSAEVTDSVA